MQLLIPQRSVTFHSRGTIDLAFATPELRRRLVRCDLALEVMLQAPARVNDPRRARKWKKVDEKLVRSQARFLDMSGELDTKEGIENFIEKLDE